MLVVKAKRAFARAVDIIVTPCLTENEPYAERSRKFAVICLAVISINALFLGVPMTIVASIYDQNWMSYALGIGFLQCAITTSIIPYTYLRYTRTMPQWMVDFQVWSSAPGLMMAGATAQHSPILFMLAALMVTALLLRVRLWYLYSLCIVVSGVFWQLVASFGEEIPQLRAYLLREPLLFERIIFLIGFLVLPAIFLSIAVNRLMAEFVERADQADAAIAMNLAVADKLRRYDIDEVDVILRAHEGRVDQKLLEAFTAIQHNLQEYRPHIPDYVIAATTSDEEEVLSSKSNMCDLIATYSFTDSEGDLDFDEEDSPVQRNSQRPSSSLPPNSISSHHIVPRHSLLENNNHRHNIDMDQTSPACRKLSRNVLEGEPKGSSTSSPPATHHHTPFTGNATTVFIRFNPPLPHNSTKSSGSPLNLKENRDTTMAALNHCILAASKHAKTHGGALQYMQGNSLVVSFNAASRITTHEAKACLFTLALKADMDLFNGLSMQASIVTAQIMAFFAGGKGQLMLSVHGDFMATHTSIHNYLQSVIGDDTSCVVISERATEAVENTFEMRYIGAINPTTPQPAHNNAQWQNNSATSIRIIELVCMRKANTHNLEWMYEIAAHQQSNSTTGPPSCDPSAILRRIVEASVVEVGDEEGKRQDQRQEKDDITALINYIKDHPDAILERCILHRLQPQQRLFTTRPTSEEDTPLCRDPLAGLVVQTTPPTLMW